MLDYADEASIAAAVDEINARGGRLDALFNNGAFASPGLVEDLPRDALRAIFEVNLFGYHDLTRRILPLMRAQGGGNEWPDLLETPVRLADPLVQGRQRRSRSGGLLEAEHVR